MQGFTSGLATDERSSHAVRATAGTRCRQTAIAAAGRIRNDQSQVAHRQVASAKIADERKPVSILEAANRDHVAREPAGYVVQRGGYQR